MKRTIGPTLVQLDGSGAATLSLGPTCPRESWEVTRLATNGTSSANPQLVIRLNGAQIDSTNTGNNDSSEYPLPILLPPGTVLVAEYRHGTAGAFMEITGSADVV